MAPASAPDPRLVLVYNADGGIFGAVTDSVHKIVSPETYSCRLCALTYGLLSMRSQWRTFLDGLGMDVRFLHRDEIAGAYPGMSEIPLPALLLESGDDVRVLVASSELDACGTLDELISVTRRALERD